MARRLRQAPRHRLQPLPKVHHQRIRARGRRDPRATGRLDLQALMRGRLEEEREEPGVEVRADTLRGGDVFSRGVFDDFGAVLDSGEGLVWGGGGGGAEVGGEA